MIIVCDGDLCMKSINDAINVLGEVQFYNLACKTYDYIKANYGTHDNVDIIEAFGNAGLAPRNIMSAVLMYLSFSDTIIKRHRTLKDLEAGGRQYWCASPRKPTEHIHMMAAVRQREIELSNPAEFTLDLTEDLYIEETEMSA